MLMQGTPALETKFARFGEGLTLTEGEVIEAMPACLAPPIRARIS